LPERRRLVLDEDINWKLSAELQRRGRADATGVVPENLAGTKDAALFKALAAREPFVLVTWDNKMFSAHAAELNHHGTTVAMVDERWFKRQGLSAAAQEPYIRDVVHPVAAPNRATRVWELAYLLAHRLSPGLTDVPDPRQPPEVR
jgi:hypothetical protein